VAVGTPAEDENQPQRADFSPFATRNSLFSEENRLKFADLQALTFDVFGTVVDWRSTIIAEGRQLGRDKGLRVDWAAFADAWRAGYGPAMQRVRSGQLPWLNIDALHRLILDELLVQFQITGLSEPEIDHLNRVWHRLRPWPDARRGLRQLRQDYTVATLSNGNVALLVNMAKRAGLPWDCILSAELFQHYKPDPEVYLGAAALLGLPPQGVMMVAAHTGDLRAARQAGLRTAFVARPHEYGPRGIPDPAPVGEVDLVANDFLDLAGQLAGQRAGR
jgi:2-haloacid dehalogenase